MSNFLRSNRLVITRLIALSWCNEGVLKPTVSLFQLFELCFDVWRWKWICASQSANLKYTRLIEKEMALLQFAWHFVKFRSLRHICNYSQFSWCIRKKLDQTFGYSHIICNYHCFMMTIGELQLFDDIHIRIEVSLLFSLMYTVNQILPQKKNWFQ